MPKWVVVCKTIAARESAEFPGVKNGRRFLLGDVVDVSDVLVKRQGETSITFVKLANSDDGWLYDRTAGRPDVTLIKEQSPEQLLKPKVKPPPRAPEEHGSKPKVQPKVKPPPRAPPSRLQVAATAKTMTANVADALRVPLAEAQRLMHACRDGDEAARATLKQIAPSMRCGPGMQIAPALGIDIADACKLVRCAADGDDAAMRRVASILPDFPAAIAEGRSYNPSRFTGSGAPLAEDDAGYAAETQVPTAAALTEHEEQAHAVFDFFDSDGDKRLSYEEYNKLECMRGGGGSGSGSGTLALTLAQFKKICTKTHCDSFGVDFAGLLHSYNDDAQRNVRGKPAGGGVTHDAQSLLDMDYAAMEQLRSEERERARDDLDAAEEEDEEEEDDETAARGSVSSTLAWDGVMIAKVKRGKNKIGTAKVFVRLQDTPQNKVAIITWKTAAMSDRRRLDPTFGKPRGKYYWPIEDLASVIPKQKTVVITGKSEAENVTLVFKQENEATEWAAEIHAAIDKAEAKRLKTERARARAEKKNLAEKKRAEKAKRKAAIAATRTPTPAVGYISANSGPGSSGTSTTMTEEAVAESINTFASAWCAGESATVAMVCTSAAATMEQLVDLTKRGRLLGQIACDVNFKARTAILLQAYKSGGESTPAWNNVSIVHTIFNDFDVDGSCDLDMAELSLALSALGVPIHDAAEELQIMERFDSNKDQRLEFHEFASLVGWKAALDERGRVTTVYCDTVRLVPHGALEPKRHATKGQLLHPLVAKVELGAGPVETSVLGEFAQKWLSSLEERGPDHNSVAADITVEGAVKRAQRGETRQY